MLQSTNNMEEWVRAFCWTFFHSLWQGLILVLLAALMMALFRKARPGLRYNILLCLLVLFLVSSGYTLLLEFAKVRNNASTTYIDLAASVVRSTGNNRASLPLFSNFVYYFNQAAPLLLLILLVCWGLKFYRFHLQLRTLQYLRSTAIPSPLTDLQEWVNRLSRKMKVNRNVRVLESLQVNTPLLIGFFKPLILFPVGYLNKLSMTETETILLHELAHIRRADYLVNLFQLAAELIFFFNPAFLWVSGLLRTEREHCCDDRVVQMTADKATYIRTLVAAYEFSLEKPPMTVGLTGADTGAITYRVTRLMNGCNKTIGLWPLCFFIGIAGILLLVSKEFKASPATIAPAQYVNVSKELFEHAETCSDTVEHAGCRYIQRHLSLLDQLPLTGAELELTRDLIKANEIGAPAKQEIELNQNELIINGVLHINWMSGEMARKYIDSTRPVLKYNIP